MDPVSRRFVWRHIDQVKKGRVILLTTHAMEEADLLADSVAIMRKGELASSGTPLQLKAEHGSALQFSVLVEKSDVSSIAAQVRERFASMSEWVEITAGDAGNMTVNIQRIQHEGDDSNVDGVPVQVLSDFVAWLEDPDSKVSEYGFSNSSLEEVFLKVTHSENEQEDEQENEFDVCCPYCGKSCISCCLTRCWACCCRPKAREEIEHSHHEIENDKNGDAVDAEESGAPVDAGGIASFKPNLNLRSQSQALLQFSFSRDWWGKASIVNWVLYLIFVAVTIYLGTAMARSNDRGYGDLPPFLTAPVVFLSLMLLTLVSPIYYDRTNGLFHSMRMQGMLESSYLLSTSVYAFVIQFGYAFVLLTLFFATPVFREPIPCISNTSYGCWADSGPSRVYPSYISNFDGGEFEGQEVKLYAVVSPGGYGMVFAVAVFLAFTMPGAVLSSSYIPGHKFALVTIVFVVVLASILPLAKYLTWDEDDHMDCLSKFNSSTVCSSFNISTANEQFLDCVGSRLSERNTYCMSPVASILPQYAIFQELSLTLISEITFISEPAEYLDQVFMPSVGGHCKGDTCKFPHVKKLFGQNLGFELLGAVILLCLGMFLTELVVFPKGWMLQIRHHFTHVLNTFRFRNAKSDTNGKEGSVQEEELEEVTKEQKVVYDLMRPILSKPKPEELEAGVDWQAESLIVNHMTQSLEMKYHPS
jgi:hypothetical protein